MFWYCFGNTGDTGVNSSVFSSTGSSGRTVCIDSGDLGGVGAVRSCGSVGVSIELVALVIGDLGIMM